MEVHPPAYLSPSRLACYDRCPQLFYERYILKMPQQPTPEMLFGTAVHKGIEAHFRGEDDELAFLLAWRPMRQQCVVAGFPVTSQLDERGLELLGMVRALELHGQPERKFIFAHDGFSIPFLGFIDLWSDGVIRDFKTSSYGWTQQRADEELFQPAIYSQAYAIESGGTIPDFEYIVLPRIAAPLQRLCGCRSREQLDDAFDRIQLIYLAIEAREFDCTCQGKYHQEQAA